MFSQAPPPPMGQEPCERSRDLIGILGRDAKHQGPSSKEIAPVFYVGTITSITNYREDMLEVEVATSRYFSCNSVKKVAV